MPKLMAEEIRGRDAVDSTDQHRARKRVAVEPDVLAARWQRTLGGLRELRLRVAYVRSELARSAPRLAAEALNDIALRAETSEGHAREVLAAFVPLLVDADMLDRLSVIRDYGRAQQLLPLGRLLRNSSRRGHQLDGGRDEDAPVPQQAGRPLTLGERRSLARRPSRATLDLLLADPHPMVVSIVLANPRITEEDVVRMASRRPARIPVLAEISKSWSMNQRVRRTLVLNPGTPPAISTPLLCLLSLPELQEVQRAPNLPAELRAVAAELVTLRTPLPDPSGPTVH